jgi:putative ABC transport system ATP-binding protein
VIVSTHDHRLLPLADVVIDMSPDHPSGLTPVVTVELGDGEQLFAEGDSGDRIYRIERGAIELTRDGKLLATSGPQDVFGEMAPVFKLRRTARAVAVGPTTVTGFSVDAFTQAFGGQALRELVGRWSG